MALEWLKGILDFRKLPPWFLGALAAASGLALIVSGPVATALGLSGAKPEHRFWLGLTLVFSCSALLLRAGGTLWQVLAKRARKCRDLRAYRVALTTLSRQEKEVLRRYLDSGSKTQLLSYTGGIASSLEAAGIIYRASNISVRGVPGTPFPYNLQPWAWDYLNAHPEALADDDAGASGAARQPVPSGRR